MTSLSKHPRATNTPDPIYGIRAGFTIGDLEGRYMAPIRVFGTWGASDALTVGSAISNVGVIVSPHARVIKVSLNITGTGTVDVVVKSAVDSYTATIADFGALGQGTYEFFLGGWSSSSSDGSSYIATQYGPVKAGSSPGPANPTGDEELTNPDPAADSNYAGGTYNPFQFLSLDGYALTFISTVSGSVLYDMSVVAVS